MFGIVSSLICFAEDVPKEQVFRSISRRTMILTITGLGVIISAVIQAATSGLSAYHAFLMLALSWVIIIGGSFSLLMMLMESSESNPDYVFDGNCGLTGWYHSDPEVRTSSRLHLFHSFHITVTSCIGIWLFSRLSDFDRSPNNCTASTVVVMVGHQLPITAHTLRIFSLVISSLLALPILNAILIQVLHWTPPIILAFLYSYLDHFVSDEMFGWISALWMISSSVVPIVLIIVSIERTIQANNVGTGAGQWTLGQTLALIAAAISTIDFGVWLWKRVICKSKSTSSE